MKIRERFKTFENIKDFKGVKSITRNCIDESNQLQNEIDLLKFYNHSYGNFAKNVFQTSLDYLEEVKIGNKFFKRITF